MIVNLLTEHHLEFLSLEVDCTGSSEYSMIVKLLTKCGWSNHFTKLDKFGPVKTWSFYCSSES